MLAASSYSPLPRLSQVTILVFQTVALFIPSCLGAPFVDQVGLELPEILLPLPSGVKIVHHHAPALTVLEPSTSSYLALTQGCPPQACGGP